MRGARWMPSRGRVPRPALIERGCKRAQRVVHDRRRAVAGAEIELGEPGGAALGALPDIGGAPSIDLRTRPVVDVAAEVRPHLVAWRHPGHVAAGKRAAHRSTPGERSLA